MVDNGVNAVKNFNNKKVNVKQLKVYILVWRKVNDRWKYKY